MLETTEIVTPVLYVDQRPHMGQSEKLSTAGLTGIIGYTQKTNAASFLLDAATVLGPGSLAHV